MPVVADTAEERPDPRLAGQVVLRHEPHVVWVAVGDELVVHRVDPPTSFVLNALAGLVWQCLDGGSPLGEILDDIADAFGQDRIQVRADCAPVVALWLGQQLVEEVRSGS